MTEDKRPCWDSYFMSMAELAKTRSTCLRRQVGAVLVKDRRILSTGYNGPPSGCKHCSEIGCLRQQMNIPSGERAELCRAVHAEQNAMTQAAYSGVSTKDSTIYTTTQPCILCAKNMINAGIQRIVYKGDYPDELSMHILHEARVKIVKKD
jgi:dCMP deaminase